MKRAQSGMTLIELVVVALLLSVLAAILYGTLNGIARARESSEETSGVDQTAHQVFARMLNELASRSFVPLNPEDEEDKKAGLDSLGSIGGSSIYLLGLDKKNGQGDADEIRFVSASAAQPLVGAPSNHGLLEVRYRLAEDPDSRQAFSTKVSSLVRDEQPAAVSAKDVGQKRKITLPLADNVTSLNFRYYKGGKWQSDWKETSPPLPEAIEVTLELAGPDGKARWYRTAVAISAKQKQPR